MTLSLRSTLLAGLALLPLTLAQSDLVGTWSTKSRSVFTGPGFYDPVNEKMFEPALPGIAYSFTADGHYEEAYYRAISNPQNPTCPQGIIQWQHGTFQKLTNGSLVLTPFGVDGRQLQSTPCLSQSIYTRYNQSELFTSYLVYSDPYHNIPRLDLFQFNGAPLAPMYLAYNPPQMLPTQTLNPTAKATTAGSASSTNTANAKRSVEDLGDFQEPLNKNVLAPYKESFNPDKIWWYGLGLLGLGSVGYFCF
ncbi:Reversal of tor2 lethality [Xylographa trunciseda]|nr:Reversal of tor2 lethality [Xylographa trunciseda]